MPRRADSTSVPLTCGRSRSPSTSRKEREAADPARPRRVRGLPPRCGCAGSGDRLARADEVDARDLLAVVEEALAAGATAVAGGAPRDGEGYFFEPTVLSGLQQDDHASQDEIFGPIITVQQFSDEDEAVRWANGVRYGLAAVWPVDDSFPASDAPAWTGIRVGSPRSDR